MGSRTTLEPYNPSIQTLWDADRARTNIQTLWQPPTKEEMPPMDPQLEASKSKIRSLVPEPPECELGYTQQQINHIFGVLAPTFYQWMSGQTGSICEGRKYDHAEQAYQPTGCGPHGCIVYAYDVERFVEKLNSAVLEIVQRQPLRGGHIT